MYLIKLFAASGWPLSLDQCRLAAIVPEEDAAIRIDDGALDLPLVIDGHARTADGRYERSKHSCTILLLK